MNKLKEVLTGLNEERNTGIYFIVLKTPQGKTHTCLYEEKSQEKSIMANLADDKVLAKGVLEYGMPGDCAILNCDVRDFQE